MYCQRLTNASIPLDLCSIDMVVLREAATVVEQVAMVRLQEEDMMVLQPKGEDIEISYDSDLHPVKYTSICIPSLPRRRSHETVRAS